MNQNIDPDVLAAVKRVFAARKLRHSARIREKHERQLQNQFETAIELLFDEVARVIDPKHPAFLLVLCLAVEGRIERTTREPEFQSFLEDLP